MLALVSALCLVVNIISGGGQTEAKREYVPCFVESVQPVSRVVLYTPPSIFMMRKQARMCGVKPARFNCKNG